MSRKSIVLLLAAVICAVVGYALLYGELFPYSPIVIGFERRDMEHVVVYAEEGLSPNTVDDFDSYVLKVEDFHGLKFKRKPRIFLFSDSTTYAHRSLSKARFCAFYNGDIVVSPWARKEANNGLLSMETYLRHELSHSLLHQHSGMINAMRYPKWLMEGIATYSSNQMGTTWYPSKDETYEYIRRGNFIHPSQYRTRNEDRVKLDVENRIAFIYSEFGCIVDYLVSSYGMEKFRQYMTQLSHGKKHDCVFREVFGINFESFVRDFNGEVMAKERHGH